MPLNVYLFLLWDAIFICAPKSKKKSLFTQKHLKSHNNTFVNNCKFM